jgi:phage-related tail fiber protein
MNETIIRPKGEIEMTIKHLDSTESICFHNTVLRKGREALASSLANTFGDSYNFFISRMLFGDGGTSGGVPKFVDTARNGLFGITRAVKPIIVTIDPNIPSQIVFTSVLDYDEANGFQINEMALQMNNGDFYSMSTFADLNKVSSMQLTWSWRISFV